MQQLPSLKVNHEVGTVTFNLTDFVPTRDMPVLPGNYSVSGGVVTYQRNNLPRELLGDL